jgi:hypothetical protein
MEGIVSYFYNRRFFVHVYNKYSSYIFSVYSLLSTSDDNNMHNHIPLLKKTVSQVV